MPIEPKPIVPFPRQKPTSSLPLPLWVPGQSEILFLGQRAAFYWIEEKKFMMLKVENETISEVVRTTVGGRQLRYVLHVIQEPAKARACGSGPRSSADRRPVDPPPVVSLNIFDIAKGEDVTMSYDSGFMLYASLEVARPIANGKMAPAPPCLPVLTGVCVASTAYLERPNRAGYFIFPDLSVRHEGWYRLKFSLFEQVKHASDADLDRPFKGAETSGGQPILHESMANRMEVQSTPFQVFSAKKFPGLSQSTDLSKVVAEQGCRVRIRREIRQRKRTADEKPDVDHSRHTPDLYMAGHRRADSRNSMDGHYAAMDSMRRASMESLYHRPTISRAPSVTSLHQASPTTPTAPHMAAMPPPTLKGWEHGPSSYHASPYSRYTGGYYQPPSPVRQAPPPQEPLTLPPISASTSTAPPAPSRYYPASETTSTKRSSSRTFNDDYAMKLGARPDMPMRAESVRSHGFIEADTTEEEDTDKGDYFYSRANGSRGLKVAQLLI